MFRVLMHRGNKEYYLEDYINMFMEEKFDKLIADFIKDELVEPEIEENKEVYFNYLVNAFTAIQELTLERNDLLKFRHCKNAEDFRTIRTKIETMDKVLKTLAHAIGAKYKDDDEVENDIRKKKVTATNDSNSRE